jgi:ribosomal protein S18 acetylase RimI-like enzyme
MRNHHPGVLERSEQRPLLPFLSAAPDLRNVKELTNDDLEEALNFLKVNPVQTVVMSSFIADNGIVSKLNRGSFFGYRSASGDLEGIALIGHTTLVEARSEDALMALAFAARFPTTPIHLIMSSGRKAERFHTYMTGGVIQPRLTCVELLFEAAFPFAVQKCNWDIRPAEPEQLELVAEAQAEIAFVECGVDPMLKDRDGFLKRVARRIEQKRIFTVVKDGILVFKADVIAETPEAIYLEGVYVAPSYRGQGVGSACLSHLTVQLLERVSHVCLLSNVDHVDAHRTFTRAGFGSRESCVTVFV